MTLQPSGSPIGHQPIEGAQPISVARSPVARDEIRETHESRSRPNAENIFSASIAGRLTRKSAASSSIVVMPRTIDDVVSSALDALTPSVAPSLLVDGPTDSVPVAVAMALREAAGLDPWLADWLASDIGFLISLYRELTGASGQKVKLQALAEQLCPKFHSDNNRFKMVTSYRGPGTEWLEDPEGARQVQRLSRGHIALMRGARAATKSSPACVHRSPPADGGDLRLLLVIDEV